MINLAIAKFGRVVFNNQPITINQWMKIYTVLVSIQIVLRLIAVEVVDGA